MTYFFDLDYFNDNDVDNLFTVDATHCGNISRYDWLYLPWEFQEMAIITVPGNRLRVLADDQIF